MFNFIYDFIYDWVIHIVPRWLWWILMTPLFVLLALILVEYFWPGTLAKGDS
jgi:hypothetical protein